MSIRYVVSKRVFGFDEKKAEKFVAESRTLGMIEFDELCEEVTKVEWCFNGDLGVIKRK